MKSLLTGSVLSMLAADAAAGLNDHVPSPSSVVSGPKSGLFSRIVDSYPGDLPSVKTQKTQKSGQYKHTTGFDKARAKDKAARKARKANKMRLKGKK